MVVVTKKSLKLSTPLLGDISSHKFANLLTNLVNERRMEKDEKEIDITNNRPQGSIPPAWSQ